MNLLKQIIDLSFHLNLQVSFDLFSFQTDVEKFSSIFFFVQSETLIVTQMENLL